MLLGEWLNTWTGREREREREGREGNVIIHSVSDLEVYLRHKNM